jgi:hypothetical protein
MKTLKTILSTTALMTLAALTAQAESLVLGWDFNTNTIIGPVDLTTITSNQPSFQNARKGYIHTEQFRQPNADSLTYPGLASAVDVGENQVGSTEGTSPVSGSIAQSNGFATGSGIPSALAFQGTISGKSFTVTLDASDLEGLKLYYQRRAEIAALQTQLTVTATVGGQTVTLHDAVNEASYVSQVVDFGSLLDFQSNVTVTFTFGTVTDVDGDSSIDGSDKVFAIDNLYFTATTTGATPSTPELISVPSNQYIFHTQSLTLQATATGGGIAYTWKKGDTVVGSGSSFTTGALYETTVYKVIASNTQGSAEATITLTLDASASFPLATQLPGVTEAHQNEPNLGLFLTEDYPWVDHQNLGVMYLWGKLDDSVNLYSDDPGAGMWMYWQILNAYVWTAAPSYFPWIYTIDLEGNETWMYYYAGEVTSSQANWFYKHSDGSFFRLPLQ